MNNRDFDKLIATHNLRGAQVEACRLVLVKNKTAYRAALDTGVNKGQLSRVLKKLQRPVCESCGRPVETTPPVL